MWGGWGNKPSLRRVGNCVMCTRLQQGPLHRLRGGESSGGSSPEGFDELPHVPLLLCVRFSGASDRPELPLWSSSTPQDPAPSHIRGSQSLSGAIRLKTSITMVLEILCCVHCLSLPYAVLSLGLSLPNVVGQLLQGTSWDVFPCAFCRSGITLLLSLPRPALHQPHTALPGGPGPLWHRGCAVGAGWALHQAPAAPGSQGQRRGSGAPGSLGQGCSCCWNCRQRWGQRCWQLLCCSAGHRAHPAPKSILDIRAGCRGGGHIWKVQGAALTSCAGTNPISLPK